MIHPTHSLPAKTTVCALLTCFNRRDKTLECLRALSASTGLSAVALSAVLVDDGSTDGTADAVLREFPWVQVLRSSDNLFWCRGMHLAFEHAMRTGFDFYLWLNDDTVLQPDALERLLRCEAALRSKICGPVIVAGSTVDAATGVVSYGGEHRPSRLRPLHVVRVSPGPVPQRCDSMTGNIVLIAAAAAARVGNLEARFEHSMGDTDYALRAARCRVQVWVGEGVHGTCADNPQHNTWCDRSLPLAARWRDMNTRKGLPWRSWLTLTRRHAGVLWPLHFALPYLKVVAQSALRRRGPPATR